MAGQLLSGSVRQLIRSVAGVAGGGAKMAIVMRSDLNMGKGKLCAQASHAALHAYKIASSAPQRSAQHAALREWEEAGSTKVVLKAGSEEELRSLARAAQQRGLVSAVIRDAGHTQVDPGTVTALAIGPGPSDKVDEVTGGLKLL
jgi:PTH2 family peptidyl-tRNA hydrolase